MKTNRKGASFFLQLPALAWMGSAKKSLPASLRPARIRLGEIKTMMTGDFFVGTIIILGMVAAVASVLIPRYRRMHKFVQEYEKIHGKGSATRPGSKAEQEKAEADFLKLLNRAR